MDHSTVSRWAIRFLPLLEKIFRKYRHPVSGSLRMDETHFKIKDTWKDFYRAVYRNGMNSPGKTNDFLLTAKRDKASAIRFFDKAMQANGIPEKVTMDRSCANKAAIDEINANREIPMVVRQIEYPNNIVGQDHRAVK